MRFECLLKQLDLREIKSDMTRTSDDDPAKHDGNVNELVCVVVGSVDGVFEEKGNRDGNETDYPAAEDYSVLGQR